MALTRASLRARSILSASSQQPVRAMAAVISATAPSRRLRSDGITLLRLSASFWTCLPQGLLRLTPSLIGELYPILSSRLSVPDWRPKFEPPPAVPGGSSLTLRRNASLHARLHPSLLACDWQPLLQIRFRLAFNQCAPALLHESQLRDLGVVVDGDQVPDLDLLCGQQVRQRKHQVAFDRALQVPRSESRISALLQQELASARRAIEHKM